MKTIWTIAKNDGRRRLKSPGAILLLLLIPLVMCGLIGAIFSPGKNLLAKIPMLVVDEDNGIAARFLIQAFSSAESGRMFKVSVVDRKAGQKAMAGGQASALLFLPPKFSDRLLDGQASELELVRNPSQQFLPAVAEEFVRTVGIALSGLVLVFQDEIRAFKLFFKFSSGYLAGADMLPFLERARTKIQAVQKVISPLLVSVEKKMVQEKKQGQDLSVFAYIFPGMAVLFLFFIMQTAMEDVLREKEGGTLKRVLVAPVGENQYVLGKIVGSFLIGFSAYWLMAAAAALLFRLPLRNLPAHVALSASLLFFAASFFALVFALVSGRRQASAVTTPLILVFGITGGSMIPLDQLGANFRSIARFTPNYWFISGSHRVFAGGFPLDALLVLSGFGLACFGGAYYYLRRRLENS